MWENLLIGLLLSFVSFLLRPSPKVQNVEASKDFGVPKTEEGAELDFVYGTVWQTEAEVPWYGDLKQVPIMSEGGKK